MVHVPVSVGHFDGPMSDMCAPSDILVSVDTGKTYPGIGKYWYIGKVQFSSAGFSPFLYFRK